MVIQAIALLDDLDKEINIYAMRVKVRMQTQLGGFSYSRLHAGMVWLALPRNGQNPRRQRRLRQGGAYHGFPDKCGDDRPRIDLA